MDSEAYTRNVKEQYEALGRFIEAFELMVNGVREGCIALLGGHRHHNEIIFHHKVMTAQPLFEIYRAIFSQQLAQGYYPEHLGRGYRPAKREWSAGESEKMRGVMNAISAEYDALASKRNALLHATWDIGTATQNDPLATEFVATKMSVTKMGLAAVDMPKQAKELRHLARRCEETREWIMTLRSCLPRSKASFTVDKCFAFKDGRWERVWPSRGTLGPDLSEAETR
jgi:hypothetical protein